MPKISVIIPVYNVEDYLEKCLDSVFSQTFDDFEVIIINDGSPDNSQAIIDRYCSKYPHKITALRQENAGLSAARNTGISAATGEYLMFLDSDDYLHTEALHKIYHCAASRDLDIVCYGLCTVVDGVVSDDSTFTVAPELADIRYLFHDSSACNKLIRRSLFVAHDLRFATGLFYEDLELIPRLALYTQKIGFVQEMLYYYLIRTGSIMRQKVYNPKFASIYTVAETLKEAFYQTPFHKELEYIYIEHLLHGAVLRYLQYPEGVADIRKISRIMGTTFPQWRKNPYYRSSGWKYQVFCNLAYYKQISLLKFLLGVH